MGKIKQSFCYGCFLRGDVTLEDLVRTAAKTGYAAVELWDRSQAPFDELVDLAAKHGLKIASMSGHGTLTDGLNKRENHDRIEAEILESIEIGRKHEIPGLICFSGNREGLGDGEGAQIVAEGFERVKDVAEEAGVNLNLELLNSKVNHPDYQCDSTEWGVRVCEMVGSVRVKLLYDIYHMQIMEGYLARTIRANLDIISHIQIAGVPGRHEPDSSQEINYPHLFEVLDDSGYDRWVACEYRPLGNTLEGLEWARPYGIDPSAIEPGR